MRELIYNEGEWKPDSGTDRGDYILQDEAEWLRRAKWYHDWSWFGLIKIFLFVCVFSFLMTLIVMWSISDIPWTYFFFVLIITIVLFTLLSVPVYLYIRWKMSLTRRRLTRGIKVPAMYRYGLEVPGDDVKTSRFIPYSQVCRLKRQEGLKPGPVMDRLVGRQVWYSILDSEDRYIEAVADVWAGKEGMLILHRIAVENLHAAPPELVLWGRGRS